MRADAAEDYNLIITIVKKGLGSEVLAAVRESGGEAGTILRGRGTANESIYLELLDMEYDVAKEIVLTFTKKTDTEKALDALVKKIQLNKPGNGIGFVISLKKLLKIPQ